MINVERIAEEAGFSKYHRKQLRRLLADFANQVAQEERERCAFLCERLGMEGCGTLYIASVLRVKREQ